MLRRVSSHQRIFSFEDLFPPLVLRNHRHRMRRRVIHQALVHADALDAISIVDLLPIEPPHRINQEAVHTRLVQDDMRLMRQARRRVRCAPRPHQLPISARRRPEHRLQDVVRLPQQPVHDPEALHDLDRAALHPVRLPDFERPPASFQYSAADTAAGEPCRSAEPRGTTPADQNVYFLDLGHGRRVMR